MAKTKKAAGVDPGTILLREWDNFPGFGLLPVNVGLLMEVYQDWTSQKYLYGGKSSGTTREDRANNPKGVDCSGFFGMALDLSAVTTVDGRKFGPDLHDKGSWQQWQILGRYQSPNGLRLKKTKQFAETDGVVRAFYLPPNRTASGIGHIGFVLNGLTIESCGSLGVCRRPWNPKLYRWMRNCDGLVLSVPAGYGQTDTGGTA